MKALSAQQLRQRKFLLVLPCLVLPFLTLAFWSLGGGKGTDGPAPSSLGPGLNLELPEPQLEAPTGRSKLSLYQEAHRLARSQAAATPYALHHPSGLVILPPDSNSLPAEVPFPSEPERHEAAVQQRLEQLTALVQTASAPPLTQASRVPAKPAVPPPHNQFNQEVTRLETLMQALGRNGPPANPEMQQIEGMLERILDIQHPDRVRSRQVGQDAGGLQPALSLDAAAPDAPVSLLSAHPALLGASPATAFYPLEDSSPTRGADDFSNTLLATIHETQTVVNGGVIKLRLLQDASLAGTRLPKGSLVYATCRVNGERLHLEVKSVRAEQAVYPVALTAFDLDGQEGIYVPGSLTREAARQSKADLIRQSLQPPPFPPSLGAQAAGAGLTAAQGLLHRTGRQVKITLKAGHQLLLREQRNRP